MDLKSHKIFMQTAIELAISGVHNNKGPFAAVIVNNEKIIGQGVNNVTSQNDPTAHAEICAIRNACQTINNFSLHGSFIYTTCEPCPMCLSAIYWARISFIYFGTTKEDAAKINFDDQNFYEELKKPFDKRSVPMIQLARNESLKIFDTWTQEENKIHY